MISKAEYVRRHEKFCAEMVSITRAKNADYTGGSEDPFANFRLCEQMDVASAEAGILIRMLDKVARIRSFVADPSRAPQVAESFRDACIDLANYACILSEVRAEAEAFCLDEKRGTLTAAKIP